jgi:formylglycine-generating enzyme required for sulfatase activity/serine/threonine protein kinase
MAAKDQHNLETIVVNALALTSPEERSAFVDTACGGDDAMRARITALLRTLAEADDSHRPDAPDAGRARASGRNARAPEGVGTWIGPYQLVEKLGEGSFGLVYLAEQDAPVRRRVALKLVKHGIDSWTMLERFKIEGRALALMDHPNIAKVLDAGTTAAGRPYFVMELVRGVPITEYCDAQGLDCRRRLELMIPVCRAIQHAHQKGIIHRDIKPSNVLVTTQDEVPVPKVIDFGVAKAVGQERLGPDDLTEFRQIIGTPAYMSPEQVGLDGVDIDTRSDIYSLGVLLYELLTGATPFSRSELGSSRLSDLWRLVREVEPPRPSARVGPRGDKAASARRRGADPASLSKRLRGDLDWIVLKCLEKDRSRRYETANGLALDIERHLKNEPVLASPPSVLYRLKKFSRRNLGAVVAATMTLVALAAGLVTSLVLLNASRERSNEVLRLSDMRVIEELNAGYKGLLALDPRARHDAMADWAERAHGVLSRRASHRATLERLRRRGTRVEAVAGPSPGPGVAGPGRRPSPRWRFADMPTQWQHDLLQQLVAELDDLRGTEDKLARVEGWLRRSPSEREVADRWDEAAAAIESRHGFRLGRQDGLFPLGTDPGSGLWEFVDLNSGLAPERDGAGHCVAGPETGVVFVLIPGGKFRMGSPPDEPGRKLGETRHDAEVSPFLISKYEITQAQWARATGPSPSRFPDPLGPADNVSWTAARAFCRKAGYRLPSEAQWEFACRGGTAGPYSSEAPLDDLGWYKKNSGNSTHPVGRKRPNPFGLYDMHGNVLEWCQDVYDEDYYRRPEASGLDPVNDATDEGRSARAHRVLRGGPFDGEPGFCRCADRWWQPPDVEVKEHGVRPTWPFRGPGEGPRP